MGNTKKNVYMPSRLTRGNIVELVGALNFFFESAGLKIRDVFLYFDRVNKVDVLGILVLYKFLEYSVMHSCFENPTFNLTYNKYLDNEIGKFGFSDLIAALMNNKAKEHYYKNLDTQVTEDFILAPIAILRGIDMRAQKKKAQKEIAKYYGDNDTTAMILQVFSEIFQNYLSHAETDNRSIVVMHGDKQKIAFACADNGVGILKSMKANPRYSSLKVEVMLKKSLKRGVTSKEGTNHLGYGLFYINEVVSRLGGQLIIYTDHYFLYNRAGRTSITRLHKWHGTIIYVTIPLHQAITIDDIETETNNDIKINFI